MKPVRMKLVATKERRTNGWTDAQIQAYSEESLLEQIGSAEKVLESLRSSASTEQQRLNGLHQVLSRKRELEHEGT